MKLPTSCYLRTVAGAALMLAVTLAFGQAGLRADEISAGSETAAAAAGRRPAFGPMIMGARIRQFDEAGLLAAGPGDLNGDGRDEIVIGLGHWGGQQNKAEKIVIMSPAPNGRLGNKTARLVRGRIPEFVHPRSMAFDDFNGDGKLDVYIAGHGYDVDPFPGEKNAVLMSRPKGKHLNMSGRLPNYSDFSHGVAGGDIDNDGRADIFVSNGYGGSEDSYPYLLMSKPGNRFRVSRELAPGILDGTAYNSSAALADIDGDGLNDLVLGAIGNGPPAPWNRNTAFLNDGKGGFARPRPDAPLPLPLFGKPTNTIDIRVVDVNGDGLDDLLMAQQSMSPDWYAGYGIQLLINRGNGRYRDESKARLKQQYRDATGQMVTYLFPADFYGDGIVDFVTFGGVGEGAAPVFWLNDGAGFFTRHDESLFMDERDFFHGMAIPVDIDGDGRSDIANFTFGPGYFGTTSYRNLGPAGREAPPRFQRQLKPVRVAAGETAILSVAARGGRPLSYAWTRNGKPVEGDGPVLKFEAVRKADAGRYRVTVSNGRGEVMSRPVRLIVN